MEHKIELITENNRNFFRITLTTSYVRVVMKAMRLISDRSTDILNYYVDENGATIDVSLNKHLSQSVQENEINRVLTDYEAKLSAEIKDVHVEQKQIKTELDLASKVLHDWYKDNEENRAVLTMVVDSKEEKISGVVYGKDYVLTNGLVSLLLKNKKIEDLVFSAISSAKDVLVKRLTDKNEDHGNEEQQQ